MADAHANLTLTTVATAPSPATSGTSLVVASGKGANFPAAPFNVTIWPTASQPTKANAEIVRVTAVSTDTLTITRAQESTSARTVVIGDQIAATVTAKTLTDVETVASAAIPKSTATTKGDLLAATASATIARLGVGSDGQVLTADAASTPGVKWATSSSSGGILAVTQYAPASLATYNVSGALAALDTTNLTVSFTVPASGNVVVQFAALTSLSSAGNVIGLGLKNHSGGAQIGKTLQVGLGLAAGWQGIITSTWYLTGLSAGTLGLDVAGSTNAGTMSVFAQGVTGNASTSNAGPAVIVVTAAP